ncbi:hypothetical protein J7E88_12795 [Streptomyces sp. ISL-10]|uniref:hypothetical protein n=1 Tax=Streptomyces sp. ISL-10 TaxID=2819172 RepID=UPI001BEC5225|nr:hypothetical protein [Streptomyces sp. ISL-10]MBT2366161.1 hypothetical protein [Streptomyces sp. ISL-10]
MKPLTLWGRFEWATGSCFRCDGQDTEVAVIGSISARGIDVLITACRRCVFHLEQLHWTLSERQHQTSTRLPEAASVARTPPLHQPSTDRGRPSRRRRRSVAQWSTVFRLSNACVRGVGQHRQS